MRPFRIRTATMTQHGRMGNGSKSITAATRPLTCLVGTLRTRPPKSCTSTRQQSLTMMPTTHHPGKLNQTSTWSSLETHSAVRSFTLPTATTSSPSTMTQGQASTKQHGPSRAAHHLVSASKRTLQAQPMTGSQPTPLHPAASTQAVAPVAQPLFHLTWSSMK